MESHTVMSANAIDSAMAREGRDDNSRAAAGGPVIKEKVSRAPTTGTVNAVDSASTTRNTVSISVALTPRASASSGATEVKTRGRKSATSATTQTTPRTTTGTISLRETPRISPKSRALIAGSYSVLSVKNAATT